MNNAKMVKVLEPLKAQELIKLGYKYTKEVMNGQEIHTFFLSEELMSYIHSNFSKKDFLLSNKLTF